MRPPKGFEQDKNPLKHKLVMNTTLNMGNENQNTTILPVVMHSNEMDVAASTIQVNPHNSGFEIDAGPLCREQSIIDRMRISLKFNMTDHCGLTHLSNSSYTFSGSPTALTAQTATYVGDNIPALKFLWRPIFNVYPEKMDAADDFTSTTVAAILGMTKDATFEDIVPITTNKLPGIAPGTTLMPVSTVNAVQVIADYNYTSDFNPEDHVWDEDLLQTALRHYTNKGALRSCLGRTRHVTLTRNKPFANFYIDKFVPRAIRRIQPYGFFAIQVHLPIDTDYEQYATSTSTTGSVGHLGVNMIVNYHEWNNEHDMER